MLARRQVWRRSSERRYSPSVADRFSERVRSDGAKGGGMPLSTSHLSVVSLRPDITVVLVNKQTQRAKLPRR